MARSHTKSGPGRTHGQCQLIVDPTNGQHLGVKQPKQRLALAAHGGNWKGVEYLSMRESDTLTRLTRLGPTAELRSLGFDGPVSREQALKVIKQQRAA
jgi:hypothetical protein